MNISIMRKKRQEIDGERPGFKRSLPEANIKSNLDLLIVSHIIKNVAIIDRLKDWRQES